MEKVNTLEMRATPETMAAGMLAIARQPATTEGDAEWTAAMLDLFKQFYDQGYKDGAEAVPDLLATLLSVCRTMDFAANMIETACEDDQVIKSYGAINPHLQLRQASDKAKAAVAKAVATT
jgi:hypothetical protein